MSSEAKSDLREKIARAIWDTYRSIADMGEPEWGALTGNRKQHHLREADAVLAVIDLDKVRADAFDLGVLAGGNRKHHTNMTAEQAERAFPNPYRKAEQ